MRFTIDGIRTILTDDLAIHLVNENIEVVDGGGRRFVVLATNAYRRTDAGWRIVLHHASPTPEPSAADVDAGSGGDRRSLH